MRSTRGVIGCLAIVALAMAAGCWYQRPDFQDKYEDIKIGMTKEKVIKKLGQPTVVFENEMFYIYDDPMKPARFRFVLNEKQEVAQKFYETKKELAKKAEEVEGAVPPVQLMPGEEEREYPGAPLERFQKKQP
jgi:hypothetical protein